jgi:hypothetical protein
LILTLQEEIGNLIHVGKFFHKFDFAVILNSNHAISLQRVLMSYIKNTDTTSLQQENETYKLKNI